MSLLHRLIFGEGTEQTRTFSRESYPTYPAPPAEGTPPRPSAHAGGDPVLDHASEYREVFRQAFALIALGPAAEILDCQRVLGEEARLVDELGVARADAIRSAVARAWYRETGRCPFCGEPGRFHDPENQHG